MTSAYWLGLDRRADGTTWTWQDGTTDANYATTLPWNGSPGNGEDCVTLGSSVLDIFSEDCSSTSPKRLCQTTASGKNACAFVELYKHCDDARRCYETSELNQNYCHCP